MLFIIIIFYFYLFIIPCNSNEECVQVIGRLLCQKDQKRVINSEIQLWELDSPLNSNIGAEVNPIDPDDEITFTKVTTEDGEFSLSGCGQDHDWLPFVVNRPEFYLKVKHRCNNRGINISINNSINSPEDDYYKLAGEQETKIVLPVFRKPQSSFTNGTMGNTTVFDWHLKHPIELSENTLIITATITPAIGLNGINYNFDNENLERDT